MLYIVSGYMRSGTSMMMKALIAGGMDAAYSASRDEQMNQKFGEPDVPHGYKPNEKYYELELEDYRRVTFPHEYEGKLIKCLIEGAQKIRPCEARIVVMRRFRDEIYRSCLAAFDGVPPPVMDPTFDQYMDKAVEVLRDRRSYRSVDVVWYDEVISSPRAVFARLKKSGWPVNVMKACRIPKASLKRQAA
jgi:hypothetical protein